MNTFKLKLRPSGMFSNVNEVVEQLRLAKEGGYSFIIDWQASCYRDDALRHDPWSYFFEPCFNVAVEDSGSLTTLVGGEKICCTRANIITPRFLDGVCKPLLLPLDRRLANKLIKRYILPKPHIIEKVAEFRARHFKERMIGLHIRGPGRTDGGVTELRKNVSLNNEPPLAPFFHQVDQIIKVMPDAGIFACSDSSAVINAIQEKYGKRVAIYPSQRSEFGEMHAKHPRNEGLKFDTARLGEDVLCDALLLAETQSFVHGNSNLSNFVICKSLDLLHSYIQA